jgi:hypothetical protein
MESFMARIKNEVPSVRVRLEGLQTMPILDKRVQKTMDWYLENKKERKAFTIAWQLLISAVNGELGPQVQAAVADGNTQEAIDALQDLLGAFGASDE